MTREQCKCWFKVMAPLALLALTVLTVDIGVRGLNLNVTVSQQGEKAADDPPPLLGVPKDFKAVAAPAQAAYPRSFSSMVDGISDQDNSKKRVRLWEFCPRGIEPESQEIGDCVSWGLGRALWVAQCVQASKSRGDPAYPDFNFLYGISRVTEGNGKPGCGSDGAYPTFAIRGFINYGFCTYEEAGATYSGRRASELGCRGPSKQLLEIAKKRAGGDAYPIRSTDEWRDAHCNGYPCTVAISWKPGRTYKKDGKWFIAFDGANQGGHQLCSIGYDGSGAEPTWFLFNSHGKWPRGVVHENGEPTGGIHVDKKWAQWIIDDGELWAISNVPGFEARNDLDLSVFDELSIRLKLNSPKELK